MSRTRTILASAILAALLAACSSLPGGREATVAPGGFELLGRVAVRYGGEGASGRVDWRHSAAADDLLITSSLGQGIARITRRDAEVKLVTAEHKEFVAADAEALTEQVLGWRLPLAGLPDWVQGRADPARPGTRLRHDAQSRLIEFRQDDWLVEYQDYEGSRPSRMRITRADVEIRLIIDQWVVSP